MIIDTHCHLNDPAFSRSLPDVIERAELSGVRAFVVPAYDRESLRTTAAVPLDRFLVETNAPSIATNSTIASEIEPCHIVEVVQKIADLPCISFEQVGMYSTNNAKRLFNLS
jgi:TatD DNase family protein